MFNPRRFPHETEWYDYDYAPESCEVGICHKTLRPCLITFYTKEELEALIQKNKWHLFLLPIYQEALNHFPKEEQHERSQSL